MARVPYDPVPDTSSSGPSGQFENIQAQPADFGGLQGAATQKLGADVGQAAEAAQNVAVTLQNRQNQIAASDAFNQLQAKSMNITAGDPNDKSGPNGAPKPGYLALRGKDAMDAYPAASAALESARQGISSGLANDAQRLSFEESSRRLNSFTLDSMRTHFIQQQNVWDTTVNQSKQAIAERGIGIQPDNDQNFNDNLTQLRIGAVREVQAQGNENEPDVIHAAVEGANQKAILARVQALEGTDPVNGPTKAAAWLKNGVIPDTPVPGQPQTFSPVRNHLDPRVMDQLENHFRLASEASTGAQAVAGIIGGVSPQTQAQGAATNSAWQRLKSVEHGEDASGNALVSPAGASGVTQMMQDTASDTAAKHGVPFHPELIHPGQGYDSSYAEMLGRLHFGDLTQKYNGNITLASAAYNAGEGRVDSWLKSIGDPRGGAMSDADWASRIPVNETRNYVQRVAQPSTIPTITPVSGASSSGGGAAPGFGGAGTPLPAGWTSDAAARPGGPSPTAPPQGAAPPPTGSANHQPMAYAAEASMVQQAWQKAGELYPSRPDLQYKYVVQPVYEHIQQTNVLQAKFESEQAKAQRDAQNGVMNNVITTLNEDPTKFDPKALDAKDASGNYVLAPDQRENLTRFAKQRLVESGVEDTAPYGKGYSKAYNDIFAAPDDPDKIGDLNDILKRGGPGGDLSGIGVEKLARVFQMSRKSPDEMAVNQTSASLLTYAKNRLSFEDDTGPIKIRDPKGEAIFNAQFVPKFEAGLAAAKASGNPKDVWGYLQQDYVDKLMQGMRSPTQMAQDRMAATGQLTAADVEKPGAPLPPPPDGANPYEWSKIMTAPPTALTGQPFTHAAWATILKRLSANPEQGVKDFDQKFGNTGMSGAELVERLKKPAPKGDATLNGQYPLLGVSP